MSVVRSERGQATVLTVLFLVILIGVAGAVLDVGAWFRADRKLQADSDAAALAGAQALPEDTGAAIGLALEYGGKNGPDVGAGDLSFTTNVVPNDTIMVDVERDVPGFFTQLFGFAGVEVHAHSAARAGTLSSALWVAPIVVNHLHPKLACKPTPCFGEPTELEYHQLKASGPSGPAGAGSFGFINLGDAGNPGTDTLRNQITEGFDDYMELGDYSARTGNPFSAISDVLAARVEDEMLFPVYKKLTGTGSGAQYEIIGWVGFVITDMDLHGSKEKLYGYFTRVIWRGIPTSSAGNPSFGAYAVELLE